MECEETARTLRKIVGEKKYIGFKSLLNKDELGKTFVGFSSGDYYSVWGADYIEDDENFMVGVRALADKVSSALAEEVIKRHKVVNSWVTATHVGLETFMESDTE